MLNRFLPSPGSEITEIFCKQKAPRIPSETRRIQESWVAMWVERLDSPACR